MAVHNDRPQTVVAGGAFEATFADKNRGKWAANVKSETTRASLMPDRPHS